VRLTLTLLDPADRVQEQTVEVVAALRNRLG
jgi:type IV pilus assembly protein PilW